MYDLWKMRMIGEHKLKINGSLRNGCGYWEVVIRDSNGDVCVAGHGVQWKK